MNILGVSIDWWQLGWALAGFFFALMIGFALRRPKPIPRYYTKRYITEIPSKLVITEESDS